MNTVPLEQYLYGVVPSRDAVDVAARGAQGAGRRRALVRARVRKHGGAFDVYADTRSQVYGGVAAERPTTTAAVDATAGQVLLYGGKVATTYFFSTSGGRTAAIDDVWLRARCSVSRLGRRSYDTVSPYHDWGPLPLTPAAIARRLNVTGGCVVDAQAPANGSARVQTLPLIGCTAKVALTGQDARAGSACARPGSASASSPRSKRRKARSPTAAKLQLTAVARGLAAGLAVRTRPPGGLWKTLAQVQPPPTGPTAPGRAAATTQYRLIAGSTSGPATSVRCPARPLPRRHRSEPPSGLREARTAGDEGADPAPRREGVDEVTTATVDGAGTFEATLQLQPGSYRARFAPGTGGLGTTLVLEVVGA